MDDLPSNRLRLLIVENDRVTARDLEATLRRRGFVVMGIAYSAKQALDFLKSEKPDLVLLDIQLDGPEDGIDLACKLRNEHGIACIFVTGYSEESILSRARAAMPAAFLRKPFSDAEIAVCLESVVERRITGERLSLRLPGLEAVSQQLPQAVFATDLDGNVVYLNAAAAKLVGCQAKDAIGLPLSTIAPTREAEGEEDPDSPPTSGRRAVLTPRSGDWLKVEERSVPIRAADGEAIGLVIVMSTADEGSELPPIPAPAQVDGIPSTPPASSDPAPPVVFPPSTPPTARTEALRKIASIASDPAFKGLIAKRKTEAVQETNVVAPPNPPSSPSMEGAAGETLSSPQMEAGTQAVFSAAGATGDSNLPSTASGALEEVGDPLLCLDEDGVIRYANTEAVRVFAPTQRLVGTDHQRDEKVPEGACQDRNDDEKDHHRGVHREQHGVELGRHLPALLGKELSEHRHVGPRPGHLPADGEGQQPADEEPEQRREQELQPDDLVVLRKHVGRQEVRQATLRGGVVRASVRHGRAAGGDAHGSFLRKIGVQSAAAATVASGCVASCLAYCSSSQRLKSSRGSMVMRPFIL